MRRLAVFSFSAALAIMLACYWPLEPYLLPLGAGAGLVVLLLWRRPGQRRQAVRWAAMGLALGFWWTAGYRAVVWSPAQQLDDTTIRLAGEVRQWPVEQAQGWRVLVEIRGEHGTKIPVLLKTDERGGELRPGDWVETVAHCTRADRTPDGRAITYYTAKGIFLTAKSYGGPTVTRPEMAPVRNWPTLWSRVLEECIEKVFPRQAVPLTKAVVMGNRTGLTDPFTTSLQRSGLAHAVAVSGMHMTFLAGLVALLLRGNRRAAALTLIPVSIFFALAAGATPSIVRATVMILLLQLAPLVSRERDGITALGAALLLLLLHNPFSAAHIGLQLSFAAVGGILLCSDAIQQRLLVLAHIQPAGRWTVRWVMQLPVHWIAASLAATAGASVFTIPLTAIHFNTISLIAPLSNLLTLWAVGLLFGAGILLGSLGLVLPEMARVLAVPTGWLADYLNYGIDWLSKLPFASITTGSAYYRFWLVFLGLLAALTFVIPGKKRWLTSVCCAVLTLCLAILYSMAGFWRNQMSVSVLDVGQGQCALVQSGRFLTMVDCGGSGRESAGDVAADYLQNSGIQRLDLLVLTHYHGDHANGVEALFRRLQVDAVALPNVEPENPLRQRVLSLAERQGSRVLWLEEDATLRLDERRSIRLIQPLGQGSMNEEGLSCLITDGGCDVLMTGDMGEDVEERLLNHIQLPDLEILVAGHHGSRTATSRELLEQTTPEYVLISVGADNLYGHPAQETLERIQKAGGKIYRTDLYGTITIEINHPDQPRGE